MARWIEGVWNGYCARRWRRCTVLVPSTGRLQSWSDMPRALRSVRLASDALATPLRVFLRMKSLNDQNI